VKVFLAIRVAIIIMLVVLAIYMVSIAAISIWVSQHCMSYPFLLLDASKYMACSK
jgi:hypothetical protein